MARPVTVSDDAILDAAALVASRVGPWRLTLEAVGDEAGLTAAGVLRRFGSKRGLLLALADRGAQMVPRVFAKARARSRSSVGAILAAVADLAGHQATPQEVANGLAFLQADLTDPDFHARTLRMFERFHDEVARLLREAARGRELARLDAAAVARAVEVAYQGSMLTWAIRREGAIEDAVRRDVAAVLAPYRA